MREVPYVQMCVFHNVILVAINGLTEKDDRVMLQSVKERSEELAHS